MYVLTATDVSPEPCMDGFEGIAAAADHEQATLLLMDLDGLPEFASESRDLLDHATFAGLLS